MNETTRQTAIDLLLSAASVLITGETDGDEGKQEELRKTRRLRLQIEMPSMVQVVRTDGDLDNLIVPLLIRCRTFHEDDELLFTVEDYRAKWATWAQELGLRTNGEDRTVVTKGE